MIERENSFLTTEQKNENARWIREDLKDISERNTRRKKLPKRLKRRKRVVEGVTK